MKVVLNFFGGSRHRRKRRAASGSISFAPVGADMSQVTIKSDDPGQVATVSFKDRKGNPVAPSGPVAWAMGTDGVLDMSVSGDGLTATFTPTDAAGALGDVVITVTDDSDQVVLTGTISVIAASAVSGDIAFTPVAP